MVIMTPDSLVKYYPKCGAYYMWDKFEEKYRRTSLKEITNKTLSDAKVLKAYMKERREKC